MKLLLVLLALITFNTTLAQQTEKSLGDFNELKVYDLIEVELIQSKENKAIITGNNKEDVVINNKNGILKIKMTIGKIFVGNNTKVILHYKNLDIVDANEGAKIVSKETIKQFDIDLRAQEGGSIQIPLEVSNATIKAITGGIITTKGVSKFQKVSILTGGVYDGEMLKTDTTEVSINAGGEASVNAIKKVDAKVRAGGDILIYGNPETINQASVLGGRIKTMP